MKRKNEIDKDILKGLSPLNLSRYFTRINGVVCVDRNRFCSEHCERDFYYVMNAFYMLPWQNIRNLTIYYEVEDRDIFCGIYDIVQNRRLSKRYIKQQSSFYTYTEDDMLNLKMNIENA